MGGKKGTYLSYSESVISSKSSLLLGCSIRLLRRLSWAPWSLKSRNLFTGVLVVLGTGLVLGLAACGSLTSLFLVILVTAPFCRLLSYGPRIESYKYPKEPINMTRNIK